MPPILLIALPASVIVWEYTTRNVLLSFIRLNATALGLDDFVGSDWIPMVNAFSGISVIVSNAYSDTLSDIYGRKKVSIALTVCFILGLILSMTALLFNQLYLLYLGIVIQALGAGNLSVTFAAAADCAQNEKEAFKNQYIIQGMFWGGQTLMQIITLMVFYLFKPLIIENKWILLSLLPNGVLLLSALISCLGLIMMSPVKQTLSKESFCFSIPFRALKKLSNSNIAWITIVPFALLIFTMHSVYSSTSTLPLTIWDLSASEYATFMTATSGLGFLSAVVIAPFCSRWMALNTRILGMFFFYTLALLPALLYPDEWTAGIAMMATGMTVPFLASNLIATTTKAESSSIMGALLSCFNMSDGLSLFVSGMLISQLLRLNPLLDYEVACVSSLLACFICISVLRKHLHRAPS